MPQQSPPASPEQPEQPEKPEESSIQAQPSEPELPDLPAVPVPPPPPGSADPPARKRRIGLIVALVVAPVALLGMVAGGLWLAANVFGEELPVVGDCLTDQADPDDMEIVDCDSEEAFWSVIGSDGDWTRGDFDTAEQGELCGGFEATERALWVTSERGAGSGTDGEVVCLAPLATDPPDVTTEE